MAKIDMFLAISGSRQGAVRGESQVSGHEQEIEISDWNWGMTQDVNSVAHGSSKASASALTVSKPLDSSSTAIMSAMKSAELLSQVVLTCRDSGGARPIDYLRIKLGSARIASYDIGSMNEGANRVFEKISIRFQSIEVNYCPKSDPNNKQGIHSFTDRYD